MRQRMDFKRPFPPKIASQPQKMHPRTHFLPLITRPMDESVYSEKSISSQNARNRGDFPEDSVFRNTALFSYQKIGTGLSHYFEPCVIEQRRSILIKAL